MRTHSLHPVLELVLAATVLAPRAAWAEALPPQPKDKAIIFYTGKLTDDTWVKSLTPSADMVDSRLAAVAWSEIFLRPASRAWSLEWEANAVKHWGIQDHWEFNLAVAGRWYDFPWDDMVSTSVAWGLGPSYATEAPELEVGEDGDRQKWLAFWFLELTLAPPGSPWSGLFRLHHRSDAFGLLGDVESSDALTLGLRYAY